MRIETSQLPGKLRHKGPRRRLVMLMAALGLSVALSKAPGEALSTAREVATQVTVKGEPATPVDLEATVTFQDPGGTIFLRDDTGVTFITGAKSNPKVRLGDRLHVTGVTHDGLFIGGIKPRSIVRTAEGLSVDPRDSTAEELNSGRYHYYYIRLSGVGRSWRKAGENTANVRITSEGKTVELRFDESPADPGELVDAELRVRGLAAGDINDRKQLVQAYVRVRSMDDVAVLRKAPTDPFKAPTVPLGELQKASASGHRVKIQAVALAPWIAGGLFLRDQQRCIFVQTNPLEIKAGDVVEALGFPEMGVFSAQLGDAECRITEEGNPPEPLMATNKELGNGCDADKITIQGRVLQRIDNAESTELMTLVGGINLRLMLPGAAPAECQRDAFVQATGLCRVTATGSQSYRSVPTAYQVWLPRLEDLAVLKAASWWNTRRLKITLGAVGLAVLLALIWIGMLRRQINRQLSVIHAKAQREAITEERQRIAREFHDTLEQELAGLTLRVDAASARVTDEKAKTLLEPVRRQLTRLQSETRDFVWDLRDPTRTGESLTDAVRSLLDHLQPGSSANLSFETPPNPIPSIPPLVQHHLLSMIREAVQNAVKHAHAKTIVVSMKSEKEKLQVLVKDDGQGFETQNAAGVTEGHFGLQGMKERARKMGGKLEITSQLGEGTKVECVVG